MWQSTGGSPDVSRRYSGPENGLPPCGFWYTSTMTPTEFEKLVLEALDQIPDEISAHLDNVDVVVMDWPTPEQLAGSGIEDGHYLLGLYEGIPLTDRYGYDMVLPDKITLFQKPIEAVCSSREEVIAEVRATVVHEVAHHFGIDDDSLEEMGV